MFFVSNTIWLIKSLWDNPEKDTTVVFILPDSGTLCHAVIFTLCNTIQHVFSEIKKMQWSCYNIKYYCNRLWNNFIISICISLTEFLKTKLVKFVDILEAANIR